MKICIDFVALQVYCETLNNEVIHMAGFHVAVDSLRKNVYDKDAKFDAGARAC